MAIDAEVREITEKTQSILKNQLVQELISKNEVEFDILNVKYRVRRPSYAQKQQVMSARTKKFLDLLRDKDQLREKDLIELYLSRGISIEDLDTKINNYQARRNELSLKIGKMLKDNAPEETILPFKSELESVILEQNKPIMEKSVYLESSIESQVNVYAYVYLGWLITEKLVVDTIKTENSPPSESWRKAWASYDDFTKENEDVVNNVVWYTVIVAKSEIPSL